MFRFFRAALAVSPATLFHSLTTKHGVVSHYVAGAPFKCGQQQQQQQHSLKPYWDYLADAETPSDADVDSFYSSTPEAIAAARERASTLPSPAAQVVCFENFSGTDLDELKTAVGVEAVIKGKMLLLIGTGLDSTPVITRLSGLNVPTGHLPHEEDELDGALTVAFKHLADHDGPYALLVPPEVLLAYDPSPLPKPTPEASELWSDGEITRRLRRSLHALPTERYLAPPNIGCMVDAISTQGDATVLNGTPYCKREQAEGQLAKHLHAPNLYCRGGRYDLVCNTGPTGSGKTCLMAANMAFAMKEGMLALGVEFNGSQSWTVDWLLRADPGQPQLDLKWLVSIRILAPLFHSATCHSYQLQLTALLTALGRECLLGLTIERAVSIVKRVCRHRRPVLLCVDELFILASSMSRTTPKDVLPRLLSALCQMMDATLAESRPKADRIFLAVSVYDGVDLTQFAAGSGRGLLWQSLPPILPLANWKATSLLPECLALFYDTTKLEAAREVTANRRYLAVVLKLLIATGGHARLVETLIKGVVAALRNATAKEQAENYGLKIVAEEAPSIFKHMVSTMDLAAVGENLSRALRVEDARQKIDEALTEQNVRAVLASLMQPWDLLHAEGSPSQYTTTGYQMIETETPDTPEFIGYLPLAALRSFCSHTIGFCKLSSLQRFAKLAQLFERVGESTLGEPLEFSLADKNPALKEDVDCRKAIAAALDIDCKYVTLRGKYSNGRTFSFSRNGIVNSDAVQKRRGSRPLGNVKSTSPELPEITGASFSGGQLLESVFRQVLPFALSGPHKSLSEMLTTVCRVPPSEERYKLPLGQVSVEPVSDIVAFPLALENSEGPDQKQTQIVDKAGIDQVLNVGSVGCKDPNRGIVFAPSDKFNVCADVVVVLPMRECSGRVVLLVQVKDSVNQTKEKGLLAEWRFGRQFVEEDDIILSRRIENSPSDKNEFAAAWDDKSELEKHGSTCFIHILATRKQVLLDDGDKFPKGTFEGYHYAPPGHKAFQSHLHPDEALMDLEHMCGWCPSIAYAATSTLKELELVSVING